MTTLAPPAAIAGSPRIGAQRVGQPGHAGGHHPSEIATSPPKLPMRKRPPGRTVSAPPRTLSWDASGSTTRTVPPPRLVVPQVEVGRDDDELARPRRRRGSGRQLADGQPHREGEDVGRGQARLEHVAAACCGKQGCHGKYLCVSAHLGREPYSRPPRGSRAYLGIPTPEWRALQPPAAEVASTWIFRKSATSENRSDTRRMSPSRLARRSASSAMTSTSSKKRSTWGLSVATARSAAAWSRAA